ncbi:DUF4214 domain-containing protein [Undibacterium sp. CY18W]|uniref:DUF4214 domain-containing protein n=1 Tax=Undibacterium hunanense TaxID=2762292 RepID=A0ABR6ZVH5_9BURK|nr:DUF4214 domain-containing protein [Undibacterium hunanense]MBC3919866.1 DUF4214 domain-containing protein [Undibacterium hunanense]
MAKTNKEFVTGLYQVLWNKPADQATVDLYAARLDSGLLTRAGVEYNFLTATDYSPAAEQIVRLYFAAFNRIPDYEGFLFWMGVQRNGGSNLQVAQTFAQSEEFVTKYGSNISNTQYLNLIYQNVLGRNADAAGRDYWLQQMASGMSRGEILNQFAQSAEFQTSAATKVYASVVYTTLLGRMPTAAEAAAAPTNVEQLVLKVAQASEVAPTIGSITYSSTVFNEKQLNDGSIVNTITLTVTGDTFKGNVGTTLGKISNVPVGLTASLTKTTDTTATLTLTGFATSNNSINNVSNLTVTLDNTSFTGGKVVNIINAVKSDLQINFIDIPLNETNHLLSGKGALTTPLSVDLLLDKLLLDGKNLDLLSGSIQQVNNVDLSSLAAATTTTTGGSKVTVTTTIKGDDGNNLLIGSAYPNFFEGGKGNDTMQGGIGIDTYAFGITPQANGNDLITNFTIGKGGDVLNFSSFLNKTGTTKIAAVNAASTVPKAWANGDVLTVQGNALDPAKLAALFGTGKAFAAPTVATKMVLITADIIGDASIWFVINQNDVANITPDEITLVGTLKNINNLSLVGFDVTNFL